LRQDRTQVVIELMPHVWSPFVVPVIRATGARYATIVHDAQAHPGDYRSLAVMYLLDFPMREADLVLTLSQSVAERLIATGRVAKSKLITLALPDLHPGRAHIPEPPAPGAPLKLLFFGRIMPYKGLGLFLDAVDLLRAQNIPVEIGVFGEGSLGPAAQRLAALGAEVVNRWLSAAEIDAVLRRYHVAVLTHTEASQSGVAAMALGAGLPIVATPVGGLKEQISHGQTGLLAHRTDAAAVADALERLYRDPDLYHAICRAIADTREQRSVARFVEDCVSHGLTAP
jgi:glycosyltransferase involved in cell wall biosynthesis